MKTIIFMIFMLIAGAVPSAANHIGKTVEESLRTEHTRLQEAALSGHKIELVDYVRQLYDAKATTRITIPNPKENGDFVVEIKHRISHIPQPFKKVIASVDSKFKNSEQAAEILEPLFKGKSPLTGHTLIFFDGHQEMDISNQAATSPTVGKEQIAPKGDWQSMVSMLIR